MTDLLKQDRAIILRQCQNQKAISPPQITGFSAAYYLAQKMVYVLNDPIEVKSLIKTLAFMIESDNKDYRTTPVVFSSLLPNSSLHPSLIRKVMDRFIDVYAQGGFTPFQAYKEFEYIHPFEDGNGRIGDLLWRMLIAKKTGKWINTCLPPKIF